MQAEAEVLQSGCGSSATVSVACTILVGDVLRIPGVMSRAETQEVLSKERDRQRQWCYVCTVMVISRNAYLHEQS
jgi:hypothetical protein